jgi:hypothetical protein
MVDAKRNLVLEKVPQRVSESVRDVLPNVLDVLPNVPGVLPNVPGVLPRVFLVRDVNME